MIVSVEVPVFKGGWLRRCIDSVLYQSSPRWHLSLFWDGGDEESRGILEELERRRHPQVTVHFSENRGIARARRFLSEHSKGDYILPVDDDDALPFHAVERFLRAAAERPWAAVIRAKREIIDDQGRVLDTPPWFPFEPRHYQYGMVTDIMNHTHPYLISRWAYERTSGWEGFEDFGYAGEDCDIYLKLEEVGTVELLDETLYYYRINPNRASLVLTDEGAYEMWRRLADKTIERIGLPVRRLSEKPPYVYGRLPRPEPTLAMVDFVIVAGGPPASREGAERLAGTLRRAGIAADAVHVMAGPAARAVNEGLQRSTRPVLCVLDGGVQVEGPERLAALLRRMHAGEADLAAPKLVTADGRIVWADPGFGEAGRPECRGAGRPDDGRFDHVADAPWLSEQLAVARREVFRAVGGMDEGFDDDRTAMVDFSLRARQRGFTCARVGEVAVTCAAGGGAADASLERLRRKWAAYPQLLVWPPAEVTPAGRG